MQVKYFYKNSCLLVRHNVGLKIHLYFSIVKPYKIKAYRNQLVFGSEWKAQLSHDFLFLTYFKYNRLIR